MKHTVRTVRDGYKTETTFHNGENSVIVRARSYSDCGALLVTVESPDGDQFTFRAYTSLGGPRFCAEHEQTA